MYADKFKEERIQNEEVVPEQDPIQNSVSLIKSQVLDLNDKFDYLTALFLSGKKLNNVSSGFALSESATDESSEA